jgi:acyl-coenzyme A thioesterase PaaI-like protein
VAVARPVHRGRTTQVWDVTVTVTVTVTAKAKAGGRTLVLFRCTQLLLYP